MKRLNWLTAGLALVVAGPAWVFAESLPIEVFSKNADYRGVRISPDGRYLATLAPQEDDKNALVVIDRSTMSISGMVRVDQEQSIGEFVWANDGRVVAKILSRQSGDDRLADNGEIFAMDADGGRKKLIYGYRVGDMTTGTKIRKASAEWAYASILDELPDDPKHVLIASYPFSGIGESTATVLKLNVTRGTTVKVTRAPAVNVRLQHSKDLSTWTSVGEDIKGKLRIQWRGGDSIDWQTLAQADSLDQRFEVVEILSSDRSVIALSNFSTPVISLVKVNLDTGSFETLLSDDRYDVARPIYDKDAKTVLGVCYSADRPRCKYLDSSHPTSRVHASLQNAFPDHFVRIVNWSKNGKIATLSVWADRNPGDYFLFDAEKKKVDFLMSRRAWVDPNQMAKKISTLR